jgi:hypothetical protein
MQMKTKNKQRQENIHECNKALEDGNVLQNTRQLNTNTKVKNIAVEGAITTTCNLTNVMFAWFFHVLKS